MFKQAIPVLHVSSSVEAEWFYCEHLGFRRLFAYRPDAIRADPCYMGLKRDGAQIHVSSFEGDAVPGGVTYLIVDNLDVLYAELVDGHVPLQCHQPIRAGATAKCISRMQTATASVSFRKRSKPVHSSLQDELAI